MGMRVKGIAVRDQTQGWATLVGTDGTAFMEECGTAWQVSREAPLTVAFELESETVRTLKVGDVVDVLEWDRKDETSGIVRMRVKVRGAPEIGWATKVGF